MGFLVLALVPRDGRYQLVITPAGQRFVVDTRTGTTWSRTGVNLKRVNETQLVPDPVLFWEKDTEPLPGPHW
jgi:hypothetical protein